MPPEILILVLNLIVMVMSMAAAWSSTRNRKTDAVTATVAADAKQASAVTDLAMLNYQERKDLSDSVIVLREKLSYLQGQHDEALRVSAVKIEALEKQMKELGTNSDARIQSLETEIKGLNKTIMARDETIAELKNQVKTLSETVEKFLLAQTTKPSPAIPQAGAPVTSQGAIPIELTVSGGITAMSPEKPPPVDPKP